LFLCLDEVQRRSNPYLFGTNRARHRILEGRGIESLLLVTKSFKLDGPMLETTVKLLATLCEEDAIAQHVLDIGGREQLENVCELHKYVVLSGMDVGHPLLGVLTWLTSTPAGKSVVSKRSSRGSCLC
jgi:hypothetical protein